MRVRQSDLKKWSSCALAWHFGKSGVPRVQSSALTFGTLIHVVILHLEESRDLDSAITMWLKAWEKPEVVDPELEIQEWIKGHSYAKLRDEGVKILRDWWSLAQWQTEVVLAREHHFIVPIGKHELEGTIDKLIVRWVDGDYHLVVSDYKTSRKRPTYDYLNHDLQFTAYGYATTQESFWDGIGGRAAWERWKDARRYGEWVHLQTTKRLAAGERTQMHYNRLAYAVEQMAMSVAMDIYMPTISGDTCAYCEFREVCGINPEYMS